jgi:hypothetical protein
LHPGKLDRAGGSVVVSMPTPRQVLRTGMNAAKREATEFDAARMAVEEAIRYTSPAFVARLCGELLGDELPIPAMMGGNAVARRLGIRPENVGKVKGLRPANLDLERGKVYLVSHVERIAAQRAEARR